MIAKNYLDILMVQQLLHFFKTPLLLFGAGWASVSPANLVLHMNDLKATLSPISALKLVASSFE